MTPMPKGLQAGDVIRCKVCGHEHQVTGATDPADTTAAKDFLYVVCRKKRYYVGSIGGDSNRGPILKGKK